MSRRHTTIWNLIFTYVAIALTFVSGVVMVPLYLHYIPLNVYGAWLASGNVLTWITILDPGFSIVVQQKIAEAYARKDSACINKWLCGSFVLAIVIGTAVASLGLAASHFIVAWLGLFPTADFANLGEAFAWSTVGNAMIIMAYSAHAANQGLQSSIGVGIISTGVTTIALLLTMLMLVFGHGLMALASATVFRGVALLGGNTCLLLWQLKKKNIPIVWSNHGTIPLFNLSSYVSLSKISSITVYQVDLFIIARILGPEAAVSLNLTRKAAETGRMIIERAGVALMPALSHASGSDDRSIASAVLLRCGRFSIWGVGIFCSGMLALNEGFVDLWVGRHLYAGATVNAWVCIAGAASILVALMLNALFALGQLKGTSLAIFAHAIAYAPILALTGYSFGLAGVAAAVSLAMVPTIGWYLPRALCRELKWGKPEMADFRNETCAAIAASVVAWLAATAVPVKEWSSLFIASGFAVISYAIVLLSLSPIARIEMQKGYNTMFRTGRLS